MDYIVKFGIFAAWVSLLSFFISQVKSLLIHYLDLITFVPLLDRLGFFTGLNIFLSLVFTCYTSKQILDFVSN